MGKLKYILPMLVSGWLPAATAQPAAPPPAAEDGFPAKPMRQVGEGVQEFVNTMVANLAITSREFDPFGLPQNPDYKPPAPPPQQTAAQDGPQSMPFADIVRRIQITTVMTGEKKFLVGSRSFAAGDRFPVTFEGQTVWLEVVEVSAQQVLFKNAQTGESAAQVLNLLPPGMTPGTGSITAPGMIPNNPQAPLDLNSSGTSPIPPSR